MRVTTKQMSHEWTQGEHQLAKRLAPIVTVGLKRAALARDAQHSVMSLSEPAAAIADMVAAAFLLGYISARHRNEPPRNLEHR